MNRNHLRLLAIGLFALAALLSAFHAFIPYAETGGMPVPGGDWKTRYRERFAPLRAELPHVKAFGYISELTPEQLRKDGFALERFYFVQFLLAPAMLERTPDEYEWVVGNFPDGIVNDERLARYGLTPVRRYGNGVVLCHHPLPPKKTEARRP